MCGGGGGGGEVGRAGKGGGKRGSNSPFLTRPSLLSSIF